MSAPNSCEEEFREIASCGSKIVTERNSTNSQSLNYRLLFAASGRLLTST
jgi:hypothetical protein